MNARLRKPHRWKSTRLGSPTPAVIGGADATRTFGGRTTNGADGIGPEPELHVIVYEGAELPRGISSLGPWLGSREGEIANMKPHYGSMLEDTEFVVVGRRAVEFRVERERTMKFIEVELAPAQQNQPGKPALVGIDHVVSVTQSLGISNPRTVDIEIAGRAPFRVVGEYADIKKKLGL